jgi:hypothetical protein
LLSIRIVTNNNESEGEMTNKLAKEQLAAYEYVEHVAHTADDKERIMWHGWALRDAFEAGIEWARNHSPTPPPEPELSDK